MLGNETMKSIRDMPFARVAIAGVMALGLAQCDREPRDPPVDAEPIVETPPPEPKVSTPASLDRAAFLGAISRAGSTYATGVAPAGADPLVGRTFAIRLPFGCGRPAAAAPAESEASSTDAGLPSVTWGPENKTLVLTLTPGDWADTALIMGSGAADRWEAVEGFWVTRPWLGSESCPRIARDPLRLGQRRSVWRRCTRPTARASAAATDRPIALH